MALAFAELQDGALDAAGHRLAGLFADPALTPLNRSIVLGLIGDLNDALGDPARAFKAYDAANAQLAALYPALAGTALAHARRLSDWLEASDPAPWRQAAGGARRRRKIRKRTSFWSAFRGRARPCSKPSWPGIPRSSRWKKRIASRRRRTPTCTPAPASNGLRTSPPRGGKATRDLLVRGPRLRGRAARPGLHRQDAARDRAAPPDRQAVPERAGVVRRPRPARRGAELLPAALRDERRHVRSCSRSTAPRPITTR